MPEIRYLTLAGLQAGDESLHVLISQDIREDHRSAYGYRWRCSACGEHQGRNETEAWTRRNAREHATTCTAIPPGWTFPPRRCNHRPTF